MKLLTLWSIIIKIIGIWYFFAVVQSTAVLLQFPFSGSSHQNPVSLSFILVLLIDGLIAFLCLFRTERVIHAFKLEKGMEEKEFPVNLTVANTLGLVMVIIGLYSLSESIPEFLGVVLSRNVTLPLFMASLSKVVIGLLLVLKTKELERLIGKYKS
ncbi:hypothetical protein [Fluviicola sp.]|uniref:hypothetical protein n=1 Tax=Fluviicola sp. TaxID=1917219 RepID=UPI0031CF4D6F